MKYCNKWKATPRHLFGHDLKVAEKAGWRFWRGNNGYNGNQPPFYATSSGGDTYKWNNCMMHGGSDPWEYQGN